MLSVELTSYFVNTHLFSTTILEILLCAALKKRGAQDEKSCRTRENTSETLLGKLNLDRISISQEKRQFLITTLDNDMINL